MILTSLRNRPVETRGALEDVKHGSVYTGSFYSSTDRNALALPAFWRAVKMKTDLISTLPLTAFDGVDVMSAQPLILQKPDPTEDVTVTLGRLVNSLILKGNAFAVLGSFDEFGFPHALKVIPSELVGFDQSNGRYTIQGVPVEDYEILHIRGLTLPGEVFGLGCVEVHRRALGNMSATEEFAGNYWNDNASPAAVLKNTGNDLSQNEAAEFKAQWITMMRGNREPVVLNKDMDFVPIPMSNNDSQFLETRVHSLTEVANIVGLPGYFIGAQGASMTYSNISEESLNLVKLHLRAELVAVERAFSALMPDGIDAKFDLDDLLRADSKSRYETYDLGLKSGWMTKDEVRSAEGLALLPPQQAAIDSTLVYAAVAMINAGAKASDVLAAFGIPAIEFDPNAIQKGATV